MTYLVHVVLIGVLVQIPTNVSSSWMKTTSFILHLKTQTARIILQKSSLLMDLGKKITYFPKWHYKTSQTYLMKLAIVPGFIIVRFKVKLKSVWVYSESFSLSDLKFQTQYPPDSHGCKIRRLWEGSSTQIFSPCGPVLRPRTACQVPAQTRSRW